MDIWRKKMFKTICRFESKWVFMDSELHSDIGRMSHELKNKFCLEIKTNARPKKRQNDEILF